MTFNTHYLLLKLKSSEEALTLDIILAFVGITFKKNHIEIGKFK